MKLEDKRLKKMGLTCLGHVSINQIPGVELDNEIRLVDFFETQPSFLCCRAEDVKKAGTFEKVSHDNVMRVIRLPEGTKYTDEQNKAKIAGKGGIFVVERQWIHVKDDYCPPFTRGKPEASRKIEVSVYEADEFSKKFVPERKTDASEESIADTIRFLNAKTNLKKMGKFKRLQEMATLGLLLKLSKFHQRGRISVPVQWHSY